MTSIPGVDYAWQHPSPARLRAAGKRFAARYSSTDSTKDLTHAEAAALAADGISSVLVRESTAKRAGEGRAAGITDAQAALRTAAACGMPGTRPIYFAVDYDAAPAAVVAYFQGVASVIGLARTGVYGGYDVVRYLLDHGLATWAWQTPAWSEGRWDPRAHIRQGGTVTLDGADCDLNTALVADYGQWMPGQPPEDDMPLTDAEMDTLADKLAARITAPEARDALANANLYWLRKVLDGSPLPTGKDAPSVATQVAALRPLVKKATAAAPGGAAAITDAQLPELARLMVSALVEAATPKES